MSSIRQVAGVLLIASRIGQGRKSYTAYSMASQTGLSANTCRRALKKLAALGFVEYEYAHHRKNVQKMIFHTIPDKQEEMNDFFLLYLIK